MSTFAIRRSLRGRYAAISILLLVAISASVFYGRDYVSAAKRETTDQISVRNKIFQQSRLIRDSVWNARESMESFLLNPHGGRRGLEITEAIESASAQAAQILNNAWLDGHGLSGEMATITASLKSLHETSLVFVKTRLDAPVQYPAMALARDEMMPAQANFFSAVELGLDELGTDVTDPVFIRLTHVRYLWSMLISNYRMYLTNRIGSFEVITLPGQEKDIELYLEQIAQELEFLKVADQAGKMGFQGSVLLKQLSASITRWKDAYQKVKNVHAQGKWRTDAHIIQTQLDPTFRVLWNALVKIDLALEASTNNDIETLSDVSNTLLDGIWMLALLGLLVVVGGYASLEFSVLRPIARVVEALRSAAAGRAIVTLQTKLPSETQDLVNAFTQMSNQVFARQSELAHQATHDALTGLVNRAGLNERLEQAINTAKRSKSPLSLLIMDLDGFKEVNDTLGHLVGDALLKQVGRRLQSTLRETDTVCRLGGDEFAILLANNDEKQAAFVAQKIVTAMRTNFLIEEQALFVGGSIGVANYPFHGDTPLTLIQRADVAMYVAKRSRSGYAVYDPKLDENSVGRLSLLSDLRNALANDGLELYYQPQIEVKTRTVIGAEALLRWNHPEHGFVSPEQIVQMAEQTGLIKPLTEWVLNKALSQIKAWSTQGLCLHIAVNLSVQNLQDDEIVDHVRNGLARHELDSRLLVLEITESAMMADPERAIRILNQLGDMNIGISIDDFGTGFSSLAYLKKLPVDELKVDRSFVMDMIADENDAAIVHSTIDLAHNLGLKVVAEGVEVIEALELLATLGCDFAQGYYFSRPVKAAVLDAWLANYASHGLHRGPRRSLP